MFQNILNRFRPKNVFCQKIDFVFFTILAKKTKSQKKFVTEKKFQYWYFVLEYVWKHSESFPTQKYFFQNFLTLPFYTILAKKND